MYSLCSKQKIEHPGNLTNTDNYCLPESPISMYTILSESSVSIPLKSNKISDIHLTFPIRGSSLASEIVWQFRQSKITKGFEFLVWESKG